MHNRLTAEDKDWLLVFGQRVHGGDARKRVVAMLSGQRDLATCEDSINENNKEWAHYSDENVTITSLA